MRTLLNRLKRWAFGREETLSWPALANREGREVSRLEFCGETEPEDFPTPAGRRAYYGRKTHPWIYIYDQKGMPIAIYHTDTVSALTWMNGGDHE